MGNRTTGFIALGVAAAGVFAITALRHDTPSTERAEGPRLGPGGYLDLRRLSNSQINPDKQHTAAR